MRNSTTVQSTRILPMMSSPECGLAGNEQSMLDVGENVADAYANLEVLVVSWKIRRMPS